MTSVEAMRRAYAMVPKDAEARERQKYLHEGDVLSYWYLHGYHVKGVAIEFSDNDHKEAYRMGQADAEA